MTMWLKQSTAATVKLGPFVDDTDGKTAEVALTILQADIRLSKNGGDIAQSNNIAGATHDELGYYDVPLDTTDTNTLGRLKVAVSESGALPVWADFMVVPAQVWDSLFGADKLQVHADEITAGLLTAAAFATDAITAEKLAADTVTEIQSGLATAANLATAIGYIDTEVAAILAAVDTEIATLVTDVAAILADTGTDGVVLSSAVQNAIADAVLSRGVSNVQDTADTTSLAALILAVFESAIVGTTWTIRKTGGTTFVTKTVATDAAAEPIVSVT
jgi:hypothetical protein